MALLLLYFILAAQFESLTQPIIVLLEIPIDIAGALLLVKLWGGTINLMTMIGLIVMSGVIINDSILKVDTINNLRREGLALKEAIYTGRVPPTKTYSNGSNGIAGIDYTDAFQFRNRVGASETNGAGIDRWNVIGNGGEFVLYTVGVLVYLQK